LQFHSRRHRLRWHEAVMLVGASMAEVFTAGLIAGSVLGGAYGYYGAPDYYDDSYGYYDNGPYDNSDGANAFN
jgi:hypothetical protein